MAEREDMLEAFAALDAVASAMPKEVRAKIGLRTAGRLAQIQGDAERARYIGERIEALDKELERVLKKEYNTRLQKLFKRTVPAKDEAGKKRLGKAGAEI